MVLPGYAYWSKTLDHTGRQNVTVVVVVVVVVYYTHKYTQGPRISSFKINNYVLETQNK